MKKLISVFLLLTIVMSFVTCVPTTAATVEKDIAKGKIASGWYGSGTELSADKFVNGYDTSKMTDGNDRTFTLAKVNNQSNHMLVIDLGKAYDITKIRIKTATTDEAKAVLKANEISESAVNSSACLFVADKVPEASDFNGVNTASGVTDVVRVNQEGAGMDGVDKTYDEYIANMTSKGKIGSHRYVGIYAPYSAGFAVSSLEVYSKVEEDEKPEITGPTVVVNKDVAKDKVASGWYGSGTELSAGNFVNGYDPSKMTDSNDGTFTLVKVNNQSNHMLVIDLGKAYDITKIRIKTATTDEAKAVLTANEVSVSEVNTSACLFVADKVPEASDFSDVNVATGVTDVVRVNQESAGMDGIDKTYDGYIANMTSKGEIGSHRYVGVYAPYSYGFAVSSLEVYADAEVPAEEKLLSSKKAVFSSGDSVGNDVANAERNIVDGQKETAFAGVAYASDYFDDGTADASINFVPDFDIVIDLGAAAQISKIVFTPYNADANSSNVVYTICGTNGYETAKGMELPALTEFASYTAPTDNVTLTKDKLSGNYRFIVINVKNNGSHSSVIAGVREIEVYGYTTSGSVATTDTRMERVSRGAKAIASTDYRYNNGSYITDGKYSAGYASLNATSGVRNNLVLDLGQAYSIAAVNLMQIKNNSGFNFSGGIEIIASDAEITEENVATAQYDVLASGLYFKDASIQKLMYIPISAEKKYRYVGVKGCSGSYMPFREFDVYTNEISTEPTIGFLNYSVENTNVKFEIFADNIQEEAVYSVVVACYNEDGILVKVNTSSTIELSEGQNKLSGTFENVVMPESAKVKVYVVDYQLANVKPITVSVGK